MTDRDSATQRFVEHRELLFSIVYNMLGSVADTEDALQETWLAWTDADQERIENPRAYLVRIAVNQALARRKAISRRRETYIGQWLPEPLVTDPADTADAADAVLHTESSSVALLVVLETLSSTERAVFVLHEVFGYAHTEIADVIGRSPAAVHQLGHQCPPTRARPPAPLPGRHPRPAGGDQTLRHRRDRRRPPSTPPDPGP
ncbi:sigma-70 family RNA polymerase sigma factor [Qaidamihabitans albus]|uniref:sigma-70 family RNA polymerase sigma factor n=1 Tax=Qaidamihabitans albus TaxID=2795733 RepID=UPI001F3080B4|nr:sigma-70 family RNA polymerase sigma factor [Qaidamihabitans albus]